MYLFYLKSNGVKSHLNLVNQIVFNVNYLMFIVIPVELLQETTVQIVLLAEAMSFLSVVFLRKEYLQALVLKFLDW